MTVSEVIKYTQTSYTDLIKVCINNFSEISKNEKYFRKKFKKNLQKNFEKKFYFMSNLLDIDINLKVKELKSNNHIKKVDIEALENDLNNTKRGLALFFERLKGQTKEKEPEKLIDCFAIETEQSSAKDIEQNKNKDDNCEKKATP